VNNQNWPVVKLGEICTTSSGGTPPRNIADYYKGNIPWVKSGELKDNVITYTEELLTEDGLLNSSAKLLPAGTLLIALYGATVGKLGILQIEASTNQAVCAIFASKLIDRDYLFFFLLKQRSHLLNLSIGGAQPNISQDLLRSVKIPLPPLPEQRRIAAILGQADELRQLRREADEKAEKLLLAMFYDYFGDPSINTKNWKVEPLENLLVGTPQNGIYKHASFYGEGVPIIRIADFYQGQLNSPSTFNRLKVSQEEIKKYKLENGNILVNRVNSEEYLGKCALVDALSEPTVFESNMMRLTINKKIVTSRYLSIFLGTEHGRQQLLKSAKRAINQASINQQDVKKVLVPIPPLDLMEEFEQTAINTLELYKDNTLTTIKCSGLFNSLLSQAFTGELTATWREKHADELAKAAQERDELLKKPKKELISTKPVKTDPRKYFLDELKLSENQQKVYEAAISEVKYFTPDSLIEKDESLNITSVKRTLHLLEAVGLLMQVSIPSNPMGKITYIPAYRALWPKDIL